jgi:hypothetical protein
MTFWRVAGVLLLALTLLGCDTETPDQLESQVLEIQMVTQGAPRLAGGVGIRSYNTWVIFEDGDMDPSTDDPVDFDGDGEGDEYLWCRQQTGPFQVHNSPSSVPWTFTIQVSIIRAGETVPEVITSPQALIADPAINLTAYDGSSATASTSQLQPICIDAANATTSCTGGSAARMFRFVDNLNARRRLSVAHRLVASATFNPLSAANPTEYGLGLGLCSLQDPGPPVTAGEEGFRLEFNKGDTIIVEARRGGTAAPPGLAVDGDISGQISLAANVFVDGRPAIVEGSISSVQGVAGGPLKFTYTSR